MKNQIAAFSASVINVLNLSCAVGTPIYLGESNIAHMKSRHPHEYDIYHTHIAEILNHPQYVGINPKDGSIEFVREFQVSGAKFVKVAVRISLSGAYFARSLYVLNTRRVENFTRKETLKHIDNP